MNTLEARKQARQEEFLEKLGLSAQNKKLALDYLSAEPCDDHLLQQAEPQDLRDTTANFRRDGAAYLTDLYKNEQTETLSRYIKLFWAIGKSTAVFPMGRLLENTRPLCISLLGKPAAAAMLAEYVVWRNTPFWQDMKWLYELAASEPETLAAAQNLGGTQWNNLNILLDGILLYGNSGARPGLLQRLAGKTTPSVRYADDLLGKLQGCLSLTVSQLTEADQQAIDRYLRAGDPGAPLPALSIPLPDGGDPQAALGPRPYTSSAYLIALLSAASFLGQRQDPRLRCAVRLYLALDTATTLRAVFRAAPWEYCEQQLDTLLTDLPGGAVTMLLAMGSFGYYWLDRKQTDSVTRHCLGSVQKALELANENQYVRLIDLLPPSARPADVRETVAGMLEKLFQNGRRELRAFLFDTGSLKEAPQQLAGLALVGYPYALRAMQLLQEWREKTGWDAFVCRCVVVVGLICEGHGLSVLFRKDEDMTGLAKALLEQGLPVAGLLRVFGALEANLYQESQKTKVRNAAYAALRQPIYREELCRAAGESGVFGRYVALSALDDLTALPGEEGQAAKAGILARAGESSKQVQELLLTILSAHADWAPDVAALLTSKKAAERLLAVQVAARWGDALRPALETALETEKSAKVAEAIRAVLGQPAAADPEAAGQPTPDQLAAQTLKGGKRRRFQWVLEPPLPAVRLADGTPAGEDRRDALLAAYCDLGRVGRSETAAVIAQGLDPADLVGLAAEVWERWLAAGAQSKTKWVLPFVAVFGGPAMTPRLQHAIQDWPQHARGAIACEAVMALALSTDPAALLVVDSIARKFKFRQVKTAAAAALQNAAKELGITPEELADRIVPDPGFSADGKRVFDYGPRSFTVRLTPTLELSIANDAGKTVKNLPAPGKTDDPEKAAASYEAFKTMKKQIRTTVTTQKARLEAALAALRCWDAEAWQALFVRNPIMHQFAISLIWGVYEGDRLTATFRYMEDGSFNTVDEEEYTLPAAARIGLVHPVELDAATRDAWKQQLEDYEITPSISQLDRPVYTLRPGSGEERRLEEFGGKKLNGLSLSGKLQGLGWYRGSVQDAGGYYTFFREDPSLGLGVELNFSGCFVGDENETVTVYDAVFYKAGTVHRGSYCYDTPKDEDILALGQVPARYYSEIVYQLARATASSTETDPDWKTERP